MCPTCGAKYALPKYEPGKRYGCKRCSASLMFGKFALLQELGRGGFGVVYKAWQADLQRVVALKFLHADNEESTERFTREARIAANLAHPNITPIYEVGQHDGKLYITMLFVDGTTTNRSKFSLREAAQIIRDAALAVDFAHARNIIHRDIKPHNIMVTREEASGTNPGELARRVYVMDFGLARSVGKGGTLTTEGQVLGTPAFMSPEQAEGKTLDARSDVYSLGATLYALATQRAPFEANTPVQVLMLVATGSPTPPTQHNPEIDPQLESIILKAMARKPEDRYLTASRFAQDLNRYLQGGVTDAGPTLHLSTKALSATAPKSRALPIAIGILLILIGAAGLLKMFVLKEKSDNKTSNPPIATRPNAEIKTDASPSPLPPKPKVVLKVTTEPDHATIEIEGIPDKLSPCDFDDRDLPPATYTIRATKAGREPAFQTVTIKPGGDPRPIHLVLAKPKDLVAFTLDSKPSGARVKLDGADIGQTTPTSIHRSQVGDKERVNVTLELKGYGAKIVPIDILATEHEEKIELNPLTGTIAVQDAPPGTKVLIFAFPEMLKPRKPKELCRLWSENPDSLVEALDEMDPKDASLVAERLNQLKTDKDPRINTRARNLAVASEAKTPFKPEQSLTADPGGLALWEKAGVANVYRILATLPSARDFISDEVHILQGDVSKVRVALVGLVPVSAGVRPPEGKFLVTGSDGKALFLAPGEPAVRVPAGRVTIKYVPKQGNLLLREFTLTPEITEKFEITGNLYLIVAREAETKDAALAIRIYTLLLADAAWPPEDREGLPAKVQVLVKSQIEAAQRRGGTVADPANALDAAMKKKPEESLAPLLEIWAARNSPAPAKANAAEALALANAKLKRPYEAEEWIERSVAAGMIPRAETEDEVRLTIRGFPELPERFARVEQSIARMREVALPPKKPGFHGLKVVEVVGKGVRVDGLARGGPGEIAGLQFGDLLLEFGGAMLRVPADLEEVLKSRAEGDEVEVKFERQAEKKSVTLKLAAVPAAAEYVTAPAPAPAPPAKIGVMNVVSGQYGYIVRLEDGAEVKRDDVLEVIRKDAVVAELKVTRVTAKETAKGASYPNGSAVCTLSRGSPAKGDEVRKKP
jgi:serine/threonine protein kinase